MSKSNFFVKFLKNINKSINSVLEQNLNKLNFNNLIILARSNKIFLTIVAVIILFLSYLSIPNIYQKNKVLDKLKTELSQNFKLNLNFPSKIDYKIYPIPHFTIAGTSINVDGKEISEIKNLKIFPSLENLFSLKDIKINKIILSNANFNFDKNNYNFLTKLLDNDFRKKSLKIKNANIFYKNENQEILFINKILNMEYYYDDKELKNILYSENEVFNMPYSIKMFHKKNEKKIFSKLKLKLLNINIEHIFDYKNEAKLGELDLIFNKKKSYLNYKYNKNLFEFDFYDKLENPNFYYKGKLNLKPFYSSFEGEEEEINFSYLFNSNAIVSQLLKTEILNNKNLNVQFKIKAKKILKFNRFKNILLNSKIQEGLIDIDNTSFTWNNYVISNLFDTLIYVKNGELILDGRSTVNIIDINKIYKFLVTPKNFRKNLKKLELNFTYNFDQKILNIKDIRVDNKFNQNINKKISNLSIGFNNLHNKIYLRNLINEMIKSYSG